MSNKRLKKIITIFVFLLFAIVFFMPFASADNEDEKTSELASVVDDKSSSKEESTSIEDPIVPVEDIELGDFNKTLYVGRTETLNATVIPANATSQTISYSSSNPEVATVSSTGVVKGLSSGDTEITLTAGNFTKKISITVIVKATRINLSSDYIVLKPGGSFNLNASVSPDNATYKEISYKSMNKKIAKVDSNGLITAVSCGSTTITVSTEDCTAAATVIVNKTTGKNTISTTEKPKDNKSSTVQPADPVVVDSIIDEKYPLFVSTDEYPCIGSDMLKYFYETGQILTIQGKGYHLIVNGENIVNYNNELKTEINLREISNGWKLCLNDSINLCGPVILQLDEATGKHMYLYNDAKGSYQEIRIADNNEWELSSPGIYLLSTESLGRFHIEWWEYAAAGSAIIILSLIYIFTKKKYWFW